MAVNLRSATDDPLPPSPGSPDNPYLPPQPGFPGAKERSDPSGPPQGRAEAYINTPAERSHDQWNKNDYWLDEAEKRRGQGMMPGPNMPQASDFGAVIFGIAAGLGSWGSRNVGMPALAMGTYATSFLENLRDGNHERAGNDYQQYKRSREMMRDRMEDEIQDGREAYALYGKDPTKLTASLQNIAKKYHWDALTNALATHDTAAAEKLFQALDSRWVDTKKLEYQERERADQEESRRNRLEIERENLKKLQQEQEESRKFIEGEKPTPALAPAAAAAAPLSQVSPGVDQAAQGLQMGEKPAIPRTAAAEAAVNRRKGELDKYMQDILNTPNIPAGQIESMVRSANPAMADTVRGLLDGTITPTATESIKEPYRTASNLARKINPDFVRNAELRKEQGTQILRRAQLAPLRGDLLKQQIQYSQLRETIGKNLQDMDYLIKLAHDMHKGGAETGIPVIDRWLRAGRQNIAGDPEVSNFDTQLRLFRSDVGQILTRAGGTSGVYSVSAQHEMRDFINKGITLPQLEGMINVFKRDYQFRMTPVVKEINRLNEEMARMFDAKPPPPLDENPFKNLPTTTSILPTTPPPPPMLAYREIK